MRYLRLQGLPKKWLLESCQEPKESGALIRHGRAWPGHPRLYVVDARNKSGHDGSWRLDLIEMTPRRLRVRREAITAKRGGRHCASGISPK